MYRGRRAGKVEQEDSPGGQEHLEKECEAVTLVRKTLEGMFYKT